MQGHPGGHVALVAAAWIMLGAEGFMAVPKVSEPGTGPPVDGLCMGHMVSTLHSISR